MQPGALALPAYRATAPAGGTTGTVTGTVVDGSAAPVAGATIQLLSGATVVGTGTSNGSGVYTISNVAPLSYAVFMQPPLAYSIGDAGQFPISVSGGGTTTQNFVLQAALYSDTFQSYTTTTLLNGGFWTATHRDISVNQLGGTITMQSGAGPFGGKVAQYAFDANPYSGGSLPAYCMIANSVNLQPRLNPPPTLTDLWVRWTCKESASFEHGSASCAGTAGLAYKFFLIEFESGATNARMGTYLGNGTGNTFTTSVTMDMVSPGHSQQPSGTEIGNPTWGGAWHSWVIGITGIGTASCTFSLYLDGVLLQSITDTFLNGSTVGTGWAVTFEMGANMNNGPEAAEARQWSEFGVYTSRPDMLPQAA